MFISELFYFLNCIKLYHWNTKSYSRHKASDDCFNSISTLMDNFIEVYIGKYGRDLIKDVRGKKLNLEIYTDNNIIVLLKGLINYFNSVEFDSQIDTDLITIKDEILAQLNKTLYLFTLN